MIDKPAMIDNIRTNVLKLCENSSWDWKTHIETVVKRSLELAEKLDADAEILEISAWLHDIKKIKGEKEDHHIRGAEEAGTILSALGYPEDKIEQVKKCIIAHSSDKTYPPETLEARILASADAISFFDDFLNFIYFTYTSKKSTLEEGREKLLKKCESAWEKIMPEAKELVEEKYAAIRLILKKT
ncbi:MAG: HD domain-containing protein [Candidatus Woesearchaeota archaeon]